MGMILRIASSRIVGQGDIVGRSGYFSLNLSANSVMRGRLDARRTLKSLVADLREDVVVGLEEGSVELISPTVKSQFIIPGEVAEYNKKNGQLSVKKEDIAIYNSWMANDISFNSSTLEYICKILSFRFGKNIKVDPSIGTRYRYMFHLHDETLDELLDMLTSINPIQYEYMDSNTIFISNQ